MKLKYNLKLLLYSMLSAGLTACTIETEFTNGNDSIMNGQNGLRLVIQTPFSAPVLTRAAAEPSENEIQDMSLYIFAKKDGAIEDTDDQYLLLKKTEGITFVSEGIPGTSGTKGSDGTLSYIEPIGPDMIGKEAKILLIANDKAESAEEGITTLDVFKQYAATAELTDRGSADIISGNVNGSDTPSPSGLVMGAVAYTGNTEGQNTTITMTPLGVQMKASFLRSVARIDLIHALPNMVLTGIEVLNASSKGYVFAQTEGVTSPDDAKLYTMLPTTHYTELLKHGISYQPKEEGESDDDVIAKNTLKQVFYLYEKQNSDDGYCLAVRLYYTLYINGKGKEGSIDVHFKKADSEGGEYVNTTRNTLYTIRMGNGQEARDINDITTLLAQDWNGDQSEVQIKEPFAPGNDKHNGIITDLAQAQIGDYYLSDGTLLRGIPLSEKEKKEITGIVFQTNPDRIGKAEQEKMNGTAHGLVMAVKETACDRWGNTSSVGFKETLNSCYNDIEGLNNYTKGLEQNNTDGTAFKAVYDFAQEVTAPSNSTGWFLPSIGQFWDMVSNLGGLDNQLENLKESQDESYTFTYENEGLEASFVQKKINARLEILGSNADIIPEYASADGSVCYVTSSPQSSSTPCALIFSSTAFSLNVASPPAKANIRPILAF